MVSHGAQRERDVEDLVEVRDRADVLPEQGAVVGVERPQQPARVHGHHDHEQVHGEQQVHGLQHVHHPGRRAAVQVVDVEHDPLQRGSAGTAVPLPLPACGGEVGAEAAQVVVDPPGEPAEPGVAVLRGDLRQQPVQPARRVQLVEPVRGGADVVVQLGLAGQQPFARGVDVLPDLAPHRDRGTEHRGHDPDHLLPEHGDADAGHEHRKPQPQPPAAGPQFPPRPRDRGAQDGPAPHGGEEPATARVRPPHGVEVPLQPVAFGALALQLRLELRHLGGVHGRGRLFAQFPEQVLDDPDPQVVVAVVPGVEGDLPDVGGEGVLPAGACRALGQLRHPSPQLPHEAGLPGAPVTEQRDRQWRRGGDRGQHGGEDLHVDPDAEPVLRALDVADDLRQPFRHGHRADHLGPAVGVPPPQLPVPAGGDDHAPVGRGRQPGDGALVCAHRWPDGVSARIPPADGAVRVRGDDLTAVRCRRQGNHFRAGLEGAELHAGAGVPRPDGAVASAGQQDVPAGGECLRRVTRPVEGTPAVPGQVRAPDHPVVHGEHPLVGDGERRDGRLRQAHLVGDPSARRAPQFDVAVGVPGHEPHAVRVDHQRGRGPTGSTGVPPFRAVPPGCLTPGTHRDDDPVREQPDHRVVIDVRDPDPVTGAEVPQLDAAVLVADGRAVTRDRQRHDPARRPGRRHPDDEQKAAEVGEARFDGGPAETRRRCLAGRVEHRVDDLVGEERGHRAVVGAAQFAPQLLRREQVQRRVVRADVHDHPCPDILRQAPRDGTGQLVEPDRQPDSRHRGVPADADFATHGACMEDVPEQIGELLLAVPVRGGDENGVRHGVFGLVHADSLLSPATAAPNGRRSNT